MKMKLFSDSAMRMKYSEHSSNILNNTKIGHGLHSSEYDFLKAHKYIKRKNICGCCGMPTHKVTYKSFKNGVWKQISQMQCTRRMQMRSKCEPKILEEIVLDGD